MKKPDKVILNVLKHLEATPHFSKFIVWVEESLEELRVLNDESSHEELLKNQGGIRQLKEILREIVGAREALHKIEGRSE